MKFLKNKNGFTLIELLVVIAVIGILATIIVASLNGARSRARDAKRKSDLNQIRNALQLWTLDKGDMKNSFVAEGCGYLSLSYRSGMYYGGGYLDHGPTAGPSGYAASSIIKCLVDNNYLPTEIHDPIGRLSQQSTPTNGSHQYMKVTCPEGTYLYSKLENVDQSSTATDSTCDPLADTSFGINYFLKVE